MSAPRFTSRLSSLGGAALFALVAVTATAAFGGSINYSTLNPNLTPDPAAYSTLQTNLVSASPYVQMLNVTESWTDPQTSPVLTPPAPTATATPSGLKIGFTPNGYSQVQTGTVNPIQIEGKNSTFSATILASATSSDPGIARYAITGVNMDVAGALSVWAPFPSPVFSFAQATASANYTVTLKAINGVSVQDKSFGTTVPLTLVGASGTSVVNSASVYQTGPASIPPAQQADNYTWFSNLLLTASDLRTGFGITNPNDQITEISLSYSSNISVGSIYGQATSSVSTFSTGAETTPVPVPVPEPPTVILAGLGAAAAVGHGYRRRKGRRNAEVGTEMDSDENGAIALTA